MLDPQRDLLLREYDPPRYRLLWLAVSSQCRAGVRQQLHQPFHLRRQVPRFPDGRQTHDRQTGSPARHQWRD